jgi:hypothetical protein
MSKLISTKEETIFRLKEELKEQEEHFEELLRAEREERRQE